MSSNNDGWNDSYETVQRRSVLASAGALAVGGFVGTARAAGGTPDEVVFDGLVHRSLGDATLSVEGDSLIVSGIGDEGDDGVAVEVDGAWSWRGGTAETLNEEMPVGSELLTQAYDTSGRLSGAVRFTRQESSMAIAPGFRSDDVGALVDGGWDANDVDTATYYKLLPRMKSARARMIEFFAEEQGRIFTANHLHDPTPHLDWGVANRNEGSRHRRFQFETASTATVQIGDETAAGENVSVTELSEGGAEPLSEVHLRAVGTDEIVLGPGSTTE